MRHHYRLSPDDERLAREVGEARFASKRGAHISDRRKDGSVCSALTDIQAAGAELAAARIYNAPFNDRIHTHGDGGADFLLGGKTVEVVWNGLWPDGNPRVTGNLIINPHEPQRWAELYILIGGTIETGFQILGWTTHEALTALPKKDFGFGERFAMPVRLLYPASTLKNHAPAALSQTP